MTKRIRDAARIAPMLIGALLAMALSSSGVAAAVLVILVLAVNLTGQALARRDARVQVPAVDETVVAAGDR